MSTAKEPLLTIRFLGQRFEDHGLDLRDLNALVAARDIIISYVEDLWRKEHGKNPPSSFSDALRFKIYSIAPGSAAVRIYDETPDDAAPRQAPLFEDAVEPVRTIRQRNIHAARRLAKDFGEALRGGTPQIPKDALPHFKRFTTAVSGDDSYEILGPPPGSSVPPREPPPTTTTVPSGYLGPRAANDASWKDVAPAPQTPRTEVRPLLQPDTESLPPVILDHGARQRLAGYIAENKPQKAQKPPSTDASDAANDVVLIEGDLSKATISTEHGDAIPVDFPHELAPRAHFVGQGIRDPKTKKLVRIVSISSIRVVDQLDFLTNLNASANAPAEQPLPAHAPDGSDFEGFTAPPAPVGEIAAELSTDEALKLLDDPHGPLAAKSARVREAVRSALLDADEYAGDLEQDMTDLLAALRVEAAKNALLLDGDGDDNEPGDPTATDGGGPDEGAKNE